jgi:CRISPR-associated protein Cmr2
MESKSYTAITIGPIIETLNTARKTRELWGASYLFSYVIRKIVEKLKHDNIKILLPYYKEDSEWKNENGAGLFPDRIFIEGNLDIETKYYNAVICETSGKIGDWLRSKNLKRKIGNPEFEKYLFNYFRFIQVHFDCVKQENIIEIGTTLLDSKELQTKIITENLHVDQENPLFFFLYHINGSFLFRDGFRNSLNRFPSLIEIATGEFKHDEKYRNIEIRIEKTQENFEDLNDEKKQIDDEEIVEVFKENFKYEYRQMHKYVAVVQADGDKIGQMVARVGKEPEAIQNFSQKLMEFSKTATEVVLEFGGSPVYMGGDDLFFFAPLVYKKDNRRCNIFEMVNEINNRFDGLIKKYAENVLNIHADDLPSLSFGISLSYYKFPLYEARTLAFEALFKEIKWADKRNAINIKFRKHSGQIMKLFVNKKQITLWDKTVKFITDNLDTNAVFINSFTHKLRFQEDVIFKNIVKNRNKLTCFFRNNFNENYGQNKDFYERLIDFVIMLDTYSMGIEPKEYLYSTLRFIHFLRS